MLLPQLKGCAMGVDLLECGIDTGEHRTPHIWQREGPSGTETLAAGIDRPKQGGGADVALAGFKCRSEGPEEPKQVLRSLKRHIDIQPRCRDVSV